jgi:hypothetical protein
MNIVRNETLIKRNARIAQFTMVGGLLVLAGGMYISFRYPEQFALSMGALLLGFLMSQVGIFYSNRWGRRPRPDEQLDLALKGLDKKYSLYHYKSPASHLLVGPSGLWLLLTFYQRGVITYTNGRWKQKGGNLYMKIFAQEGLGRPEVEVESEKKNLLGMLNKIFSEDEIPPINAALVFTNPRVTLDIPEGETPPDVAVTVKDLKDAIRKTGKSKSLSPEKIAQICEAIENKK